MTQRKQLFADHRRVGKKFIPPMAGVTEIHYIERILPEIIWIGYFVKHLGSKKGVETAGILIESCHFLKEWAKQPDFSLQSSYRILDLLEWAKVEKHLKGKGIFLDCLDALTPFVRCYPTDNPFLSLLRNSTKSAPSIADINLAGEVVASLFDRRSKEASIVQSVALWIDIKVGKYQVLPDFPFRDFNSIFGNFESPQGDELSANARMHVNGNFMFHNEQIGESWATYFWNRGRELKPLASENMPPEVQEKGKLRPLISFGMDYERYAWGVVDDIWSKLPVDIYQSEFFEVIGALLARQCNLAVKVARNCDLWDYHAGPLFLRPMTDTYITAAWIFRDRLDRARKFILYGLGQEKLQIERLKSLLDKQEPEDRKRMERQIKIQESWLNGQHYSFLQHVDVGSWSGISTRKMAEEADCLNLYDFAYTGWSHAAHGTWNHVGRFDAWPSHEPLHKHIWQPANLEHGFQVDVVEQATKYLDEFCNLVVSEFKLKMEISNPNVWLEQRLTRFFAEIEKCKEG